MIKEVSFEVLKTIFDKGESPFRKYYIYEEDINIIGYVVIDIIYDRIEIVDIFVDPLKRNRKIGTNMLKYIIDLARSNKISNITLEVNINNDFAIKLYQNFGFTKVAMRKSYYEGTDGILMELIL